MGPPVACQRPRWHGSTADLEASTTAQGRRGRSPPGAERILRCRLRAASDAHADSRCDSRGELALLPACRSTIRERRGRTRALTMREIRASLDLELALALEDERQQRPEVARWLLLRLRLRACPRRWRRPAAPEDRDASARRVLASVSARVFVADTPGTRSARTGGLANATRRVGGSRSTMQSSSWWSATAWLAAMSRLAPAGRLEYGVEARHATNRQSQARVGCGSRWSQ